MHALLMRDIEIAHCLTVSINDSERDRVWSGAAQPGPVNDKSQTSLFNGESAHLRRRAGAFAAVTRRSRHRRTSPMRLLGAVVCCPCVAAARSISVDVPTRDSAADEQQHQDGQERNEPRGGGAHASTS
jgi:hypothetical protein